MLCFVCDTNEVSNNRFDKEHSETCTRKGEEKTVSFPAFFAFLSRPHAHWCFRKVSHAALNIFSFMTTYRGVQILLLPVYDFYAHVRCFGLYLLPDVPRGE